MASKIPGIEGGSMNRPPFFNGEGYSYWRDRMRIFLQGVDYEIWDAIENGPFVPTHQSNDKVVEKPRSIWTEEEKKKVQYSLKAKNIITAALSFDEFHRVSDCDTAKEMWDTLQVTHEGTSEVKRARMNTLTHEYELFRMNPNESIKDMQKRFIHIKNNLKTLGKTFSNEDMINKVLRCLNRNWQPKVTAISESRDLSSMSLATLFGKLQEHELELNRLNESEETDKKKKTLALKSTTNEDSNDSLDENEEDMSLMVRKFKKFLRHTGKPKHFSSSQKKSKDSSNFTPTCYKCGEKGHIKPECPLNEKRQDKNDKRVQKDSRRKRAYIAWEDNDTDSSDSEVEEANLCLMARHEEEEVNSQDSELSLSYDELFTACEELNFETIKLGKIVSSSKKTISSLEMKIQTLTKEMELLKEKQFDITNASICISCETKKDEVPECKECSTLKIKNEDLCNTLAKFTKPGETKKDEVPECKECLF